MSVFPFGSSGYSTFGLDVFSRGIAAPFGAPVSAYPLTFRDAEGLTDTAARAAAYARTITDAVGLTDLISNAKTQTKSDPIGLTDVITRTTAHSRTVTDALGILDAVIPPSNNKQITISDALDLSDAGGPTGPDVNDLSYFRAGRPFGRAISKADTLTLDFFARGVGIQFGTRPRPITSLQVVTYVRLRTDAEGLTDALSQAKVGVISNPVGMTDVVQVVVASSRAISDLLGLVDPGLAVTTSVDPLGITDAIAIVRGKNITDVEPLSDVMRITRGKVATDPLGIHDAIIVTPGHFPVISNPVGLTDSVRRDAGKVITNPLGITDAVAYVSGAQPALSDALGMTDVVKVTSSTFRTISDGEGLGDAVQASGPTGFSLTIFDLEPIHDAVVSVTASGRPLDDPLGMSDAVARTVARFRSRDDAEPLSDAIVVMHGWSSAVGSDALGIADVVIQFSPQSRAASDIISLSDVALVTHPAQPVLNDTLGLSDTIILHGSAVVGPPVNWRWRIGPTVGRWEVGKTTAL